MAVLLLCISLPVWGQPVKTLPRPAKYVSDFAHVMSPGATRRLNRLCGRVERKTHDRIDVVTVVTTGKEPIEQYAANLQRAWKTGGREAMVVVAVRDRRRWIAASGGLRAALPRAVLNRISGQMVPMLRNNDFDGAMTLAVDELGARMARNAGVKMNLRLPWGAPAAAPARDAWATPVMEILGALLVASFLVWAYASGLPEVLRRKMNRGTGRKRR